MSASTAHDPPRAEPAEPHLDHRNGRWHLGGRLPGVPPPPRPRQPSAGARARRPPHLHHHAMTHRPRHLDQDLAAVVELLERELGDVQVLEVTPNPPERPRPTPPPPAARAPTLYDPYDLASNASKETL
jgi:hypothetical protein